MEPSRISPIPAACVTSQKQWDPFGGVWILKSNLGCCDPTAPPGTSQGQRFQCLTQNCFFSGGQCHFPCIFLLCQCRILTQLYMETWLGLPNQHRTELQEPMGRQNEQETRGIQQQNSETLGEASWRQASLGEYQQRQLGTNTTSIVTDNSLY